MPCTVLQQLKDICIWSVQKHSWQKTIPGLLKLLMTDLSLNGTNILQLAPDLPVFNLSILNLYNPAQHVAFVTL